ncbi:MAG: ABC transporter permease, partial [Candidatus Methylomirabilaceae bacterium]
MRSRPRAPAMYRPSLALKLSTGAVLLFLHFPVAIIILYMFTTDDAAFRFPPPGLTVQWFGAAWQRPDIRRALALSLQVASVATLVALVLGTLAATAVHRSRFFGRET